MQVRWSVIISGLLLHAATAGASSHESVKVLRAYGPGGPHHVLRECADLFREKFGVIVVVIRASPAVLARKIREDGDMYFGGAEYMLADFSRENPGVLDMHSMENLHPRRVGVVVRKGNPLKIKGVECLQRDGVDLLETKHENMRQFYAVRPDRMKNLRHQVYSGQEGLDAWRSARELDAWVTYESWHVLLEEESEFIEISGDHALRFTTVALTRRTPHRQAAGQFIAFLKSPEARQIFVEHGWE